MDRIEEKLGFDRVRQAISDRCSTEYAARRVEEETFCTDSSVIRHRLQITDEMRLVVMFEESFPASGYIDGLPFLIPLQKDGGNIDLLSLGKLRTMTDTVRKILAFLGGIKDGVYPLLKALAKPVAYFPEVQRRIDSILDRHGEIKDTASDELYDIRKRLKDKEGAISKRAGAILRKAQEDGLSDPDMGLSVRDGKYLIPVSTANKRKLSGLVYDESASGKTTFIEPAEIVEMENEINELHFAETREIARILSEFSDFVRPYVPELMEEAEFIGEVDFLMAKAQVALDYIAGVPVISDSGEMLLRKARHPLLEKTLHKEGKEIVPLSVTLTPQKHILLISGPNAGGKSVCLKTVGLLQYMFQWGMLIPTSEASEMPVFDRIMLSIGDDQSIDNDLSTYSSFLKDMKEMLSSADSRTLVLIDEFGSGTEPAAGGAIAEAILGEMDRRGTYGVITTHYTNLKLYASGDDTGVTNGAMLFDAANMAPLFRLETGMPGNSFAFELARKMGLPESIVKDAETRAGDEFVGMERNLRRIARNRKAMDERLQRIKKTDKTLENITGKYEQELLDIKEQRQSILNEARREAESIVKEANRQVEHTIRVIKESQAEQSQTREAREELREFVNALQERKMRDSEARDRYIDGKLERLAKRKGRSGSNPPAPAQEQFRSGPLKVGEKVRVKDNGMVGEITRLSGKSVTIAIGNITSKLSPARVERISSNEFKAAVKDMHAPPLRKVDAGIEARKLNFKTEIDVRGMRLADAIDTVARYADDALMLNVSSVRIIHGKGTGVLRDEIQKYLRTMPGVVGAKDEQVQFGGSGVTVVTFG